MRWTQGGEERKGKNKSIFVPFVSFVLEHTTILFCISPFISFVIFLETPKTIYIKGTLLHVKGLIFLSLYTCCKTRGI